MLNLHENFLDILFGFDILRSKIFKLLHYVLHICSGFFQLWSFRLEKGTSNASNAQKVLVRSNWVLTQMHTCCWICYVKWSYSSLTIPSKGWNIEIYTIYIHVSELHYLQSFNGINYKCHLYHWVTLYILYILIVKFKNKYSWFICISWSRNSVQNHITE